MSGHTPGPWFGRRSHDPVLIAGHYEVGLEIAFSCSPSPEKRAEYQANARLIAAAPELLEAVVSAAEWHLGDKWRYCGNRTLEQRWAEQRDMYDAAIAKATGEAK